MYIYIYIYILYTLGNLRRISLGEMWRLVGSKKVLEVASGSLQMYNSLYYVGIDLYVQLCLNIKVTNICMNIYI